MSDEQTVAVCLTEHGCDCSAYEDAPNFIILMRKGDVPKLKEKYAELSKASGVMWNEYYAKQRALPCDSAEFAENKTQSRLFIQKKIEEFTAYVKTLGTFIKIEDYISASWLNLPVEDD